MFVSSLLSVDYLFIFFTQRLKNSQDDAQVLEHSLYVSHCARDDGVEATDITCSFPSPSSVTLCWMELN